MLSHVPRPCQSRCTVQVYEQRSLPDPMHRNLDRSYHLAMSHRGMGAVEQVTPYVFAVLL